jgi:hypothetical protein
MLLGFSDTMVIVENIDYNLCSDVNDKLVL